MEILRKLFGLRPRSLFVISFTNGQRVERHAQPGHRYTVQIIGEEYLVTEVDQNGDVFASARYVMYNVNGYSLDNKGFRK
ncbi:hypothetical protein VPHD479_0209 [Vibrio phage D479]